jgi:hypothetical protein
MSGLSWERIAGLCGERPAIYHLNHGTGISQAYSCIDGQCIFFLLWLSAIDRQSFHKSSNLDLIVGEIHFPASHQIYFRMAHNGQK